MEVLDQYAAVVGVAAGPASTMLYLRGQKLHSLSIDALGRISILTPEKAAAEFESFCNWEMTTHSTDRMKLFRLMRLGERYEMTFYDGRKVYLTADEYGQIRKGVALPPGHEFSLAVKETGGAALVLYADPFMQKTGPALRDGDSFVYALQRCYPAAKFHRDPLSPETAARAAALEDHALKGLGDLMVVVAEDSFKVPRNGTILNIETQLTALGVKPVIFKPDTVFEGPRGKTVIVITGHTSEELLEFIRALGDAGFLKDNYVMVESCEAELTERMIAEISTRYQAAGVFCHEGRISVGAVQDFLLDFVRMVRSSRVPNLRKLLIESLHRFRLNGVWFICKRLEPGPSEVG